MVARRNPAQLMGPRMDADYPDLLELPHTIANVDRRCMLIIDSKDKAVTSASWYDIWEAATVLTSRCVKGQGKTGRITNLGTNGKIHISLFDE